MYDFCYGTKQEILDDPESFIIFVKRLLPRWINGIPDSECIALYRSLSLISNGEEKTNLIETGCGASTIAMVVYSIINGAHVYSWDTNGSKGSFLRTVILDAICRPLGVNIFDYWTFTAFDSTNEHIGIPVLSEIGVKATFGFFDSWHTFDHLITEVNCFLNIASPSFVLAIDDAYYTCKSQNYSYINMLRSKLSLPPILDTLDDNTCPPFYEGIEQHLSSRYSNVTKIDDSYKSEFGKDIFFSYYSGDRKTMNRLGMESVDKLAHRFDAWLIN